MKFATFPTHVIFQSTLPVGGATDLFIYLYLPEHISIHAPRGGSDRPGQPPLRAGAISIHAPRGGSDLIFRRKLLPHLAFQSTLPVGGATFLVSIPGCLALFQSTLPVGGATSISAKQPDGMENFNPRSPWGERRCFVFLRLQPNQFQSTLPVGGATNILSGKQKAEFISIHAPRGGSDGAAAA